MSTTNSDEDATEAGAVVDFLGRYSTADSDRERQSFLKEELEALAFGAGYGDYSIKQFAQRVVDYSSQYGSNYSISYTASNITGRPSNFPEYGDFPETFAMRSYGEWWQTAPSGTREIQPQNSLAIPADDFIVVTFEDYLMPEEVCVFETYNPGAVVRIWAYTIAKTWFLLWEAGSEFLTRPVKNVNKARRFSPPLRKLLLPTKTIRLEFNHSRLSYFTEIDGLMLGGKNINTHNAQKLLEIYQIQKSGSILSKLQSLQFRPTFRENYKSHMQEFLTRDLEKYLVAIENPQPAESEEAKTTKKVTSFKDFPFEIVLNIFSYLDLKTLFRVGAVSRYLYDVSTHPSLYHEINLKPYWDLVTTELIYTLAKRAKFIKKLDLSWCGLYNSISTTEFKKFIQQRGDTLTHLRLNSCSFLTAPCIETVGIVCDNLKELSLRNYATEEPVMFQSLMNLRHLERLDLFQTVTEADLLLIMLENNPKLKHINLSSCGVGVFMDQVAQHIGTYNKNLISLDLWKSHSLSGLGLYALAACHDLEELDIGWCLRDVSLGDSFRYLLQNCPNIKKLCLATCRGITDQDVADIAFYCPNLQQLDLMGVFGIAKDRYFDILTRCSKLELLDVSFCDNLDSEELRVWARAFNVDIKCTHMSADVRY